MVLFSLIEEMALSHRFVTREAHAAEVIDAAHGIVVEANHARC